MSADLTTTEKKAWEKASCIEEQDPDKMRQDPDKMRQDKNEIWMDRNMCNVVGCGGWAVDDHGNAVAYQMYGLPVMGDALLQNSKPIWRLPSSTSEDASTGPPPNPPDEGSSGKK